MRGFSWGNLVIASAVALVLLFVLFGRSGEFDKVGKPLATDQSSKFEKSLIQLQGMEQSDSQCEEIDYIYYKEDKVTKELKQVPSGEKGASRLYLYVRGTRVDYVRAFSKDGKSVTMVCPSALFRIEPTKIDVILSQPHVKQSFSTIPFSGTYVLSTVDGLDKALTDGLMKFINDNDAGVCGNLERTKVEIGHIISSYLDEKYGVGVTSLYSTDIKEIY